MYTKGYVNQEIIVSQRAYPVSDATDGACFSEASLNPTASSATTYRNGIMAKNHHIHRGDTQRPALAHRFRRRQSHNENQLDEEQWDGQNPVHIPIGIVERRTREAAHVVALLRVELHVESIIPGVEDAEVVVGRDEGHQAGDGERRSVLLAHVVDLDPEEDRRASHPRDAERESVVHRAPASVVPSIDEGCHDELSENDEQFESEPPC